MRCTFVFPTERKKEPVFSLCLTSGPMCSVCVVRSVIWQSFIFRVALALSCIQNIHPLHQPCPKADQEKKKKPNTSKSNKSEELNALLEDRSHRQNACPGFFFFPASPGTQRGHKYGLKCSKTSRAKYWTRNYQQR